MSNLSRPEIVVINRKRLAGKQWRTKAGGIAGFDFSARTLMLPTVDDLRDVWEAKREEPCPINLDAVLVDIERHELIHGAISPTRVDFPASVNQIAGQLAEDLNVASFGQKLFGRFYSMAEFRIGHAILTDEQVDVLSKASPETIQIHDALAACGCVELGMIPDSVPERVRNKARALLTDNMAYSVFCGYKSRKWPRKSVYKLADTIMEVCFPANERKRLNGQEATEEAVGWIPHTLERPPLGDIVPAAKGQNPKAATCGIIPRYMSRYTSGKVFAKVVKRAVSRDAFLVDVSGSMDWNINHLIDFLQRLSPKGTVITYGHPGDPMEQKEPMALITVVAENGRRIPATYHIKALGGTNGCDGPALKYLASLKGFRRKYWVSDGQVNGMPTAGGRICHTAEMINECSRTCEHGHIKRVRPDELREALTKEQD